MTDHFALSPDDAPPVAADGVWLACVACGATHPPFDAPVYRCPDCGGLLEARYDEYPGLRGGDGGVWAYESVMPVSADEGVTLAEGDTPYYAAPGVADAAGLDAVRVKHEGANPTGSFKDRGMTVGVGVARRLGVGTLACASTGNTSAALAAYGARAGLGVYVLLPAGKVAAGKVAQAALHGASILEVDGNFDDCLDHVAGLADGGEVYLLNSLNPYRLEGQKTIGYEALAAHRAEFGDWPDRIVLPVGNAGNTAALYKCFRELVAAGEMERDEMPALTGVQASGAAPFVEAVREGRDDVTRWTDVETRATAIRIGDPVNAPKALPGVRATGGTAVAVDDEAITAAQRRLAEDGVGVEPASAASVAGLLELRERGVVADDERVACLTTGHLLKDPDAAAAAGGDPVPVANDREAVRAAMRD